MEWCHPLSGWIFLHELLLTENILTDVPRGCLLHDILLLFVCVYFVYVYVCELCAPLMSTEA